MPARSGTARVAVTLALERELADRIRTAGGDAIDLVPPAPGAGSTAFWPSDREVEAVASGLDLDAVAGADVVLSAWTPALQARLRAIAPAGLARLRWLQLTTAGADRVAGSALLPPGVAVTTTRGAHATPIAEFVLAGILAVLKRLPRLLAMQRAHEWSRVPPDELHGKTVGVVGFGGIGREVGRLAKAFGCRVIGVRRSAGPGDAGAADRLLTPSGLLEVLHESDIVVLAVPLTPQTRGLIGPRELAAMKPTAILVNVARGAVVDEAALVVALRERRIAAAVLDTFAEEPLPAGSPLWDLDGVVVSPHVAGGAAYNRRVVECFAQNLTRWLAGEPLRNLEPR